MLCVDIYSTLCVYKALKVKYLPSIAQNATSQCATSKILPFRCTEILTELKKP